MSEIKNSLQSCPCKQIVDGWLGRGKKERVESEKKERVESEKKEQDASEVITSEIMVTKDFTK